MPFNVFFLATSHSARLTHSWVIYYLAEDKRKCATASRDMACVPQAVDLDRIHLSNGVDTANPSEEHGMFEEIEQVSLPPTDRGKEAWLVLAGCSLIQIPVWGMRSSVKFVRNRTHTPAGYSIAFGVFQEYYGSHPEKLKGDSSNVAVIGTTMTVSLQLVPLRPANTDWRRESCT